MAQQYMTLEVSVVCPPKEQVEGWLTLNDFEEKPDGVWHHPLWDVYFRTCFVELGGKTYHARGLRKELAQMDHRLSWSEQYNWKGGEYHLWESIMDGTKLDIQRF